MNSISRSATGAEPQPARAAPDAARPRSPGIGDLSAQAVRLHAYGVIAAIRSDSGGLLGRAEADRLAALAGALIEELVEAGLWLETDLSYVVRADALGAALREA